MSFERACVFLQCLKDGGLVTSKIISFRTKYSLSSIDATMRTLSSAGLVTGIKGPGGGYKLAVPYEEIKIKDLVGIINKRNKFYIKIVENCKFEYLHQI